MPANQLRAARHAVRCEDCVLRRQPSMRTFTSEEFEFVRGFKAGDMLFDAGHDLVLAGHELPQFFTLYEGWAFRYVLLPDGRRQILNFALPGDLLGLQSALFDRLEHSVQALTNLRLCIFDRRKLFELYRTCPSLGFDVTWLAAQEERLVDMNLTSVGQHSARERVAYLLLHLVTRLEALALNSRNTIDFPLNQTHIADAIGLSVVHTNRTLRDLNRRGLVTITQHRLTVHDRPALERLATGVGLTSTGGPRPFI